MVKKKLGALYYGTAQNRGVATACKTPKCGPGFLTGGGGRFSVEAKSKNARVYEISAHVKEFQVVKINPEPTTTARLIACVASAR